MCNRRADFTPFIEFIISCTHPYHFDPCKKEAILLRIAGSNFPRINDSPKTKARLTHEDSHSILENLGSQLSPKSLSPPAFEYDTSPHRLFLLPVGLVGVGGLACS